MMLTKHDELVSEFILRRWTGKPFVMVEGVTDRALWAEYSDCDPIPTQGKELILDALNSYMLREAQGIAGIVDLDYTLISQTYQSDMPNLLYDGCCPDMEMILLGSPALKKVLRHELPDVDIDAAHNFAELLSRESQNLAAEYGYFRWLNEREQYGLSFKALRVQDFVDSNALTLDCKWLARRLAEGRDGISSDELFCEVGKLRELEPPDNVLLCRGKDVIAIMAHILPALYESRFGEALPDSAREIFQAKRLAKELRKAYEYIYFTDTSLFGCIQNWENSNRPYKILKA